MNDKIRSVTDLIESLQGSLFIQDGYIYRGQVNEEWKTKPSLLRRNADMSITIKTFENALFSPLFQNMKIPFLTLLDPIEYLSILQHFEFPTRLLDWAYDPLVALFFSCYSQNNEFENKDGVFIASNSLQYETIDLRKNTEYIMNYNFDNIDKNLFWSKLNNDDILIIKQLFKNPRLRNQNGCFMLFPLATINIDDSEYFSLEEYVKFKDSHLKKLNNEEIDDKPKYVFLAKKLIDKNYKKAILLELEKKHGICKDSLFPLLNNDFEMEEQFREMYISMLNYFPK